MMRAAWIVGALVLLGAGLVLGRGFYVDLQVGAGYAAKHMCSCVHVAERSTESCRADLPAAMQSIQVAARSDPAGFAASILGIEREARVQPEGGCTLR